MIKPERRSEQTDTHLFPTEQVGVASDAIDQQIQRISRIGKRIFDVADCVVAIDDKSAGLLQGGQSKGSIGEIFCYGLQQPSEPKVVQDTKSDSFLSQHRSVAGAPYIRFYATHPIHNQDGVIIGSINLIDFTPRKFSADDRKMFSDLAALVDREVHFRLINASQIDLQKKNKSLRRKSLIDPMLGIWNRGAIMRILTIEAIRCDKIGAPISLIVADLDFFKKINDTYGHPAGDSVLVSVATKLRNCIRPQEALGRYGGEEFLIVLPGASHTTAMSVAERMRREVAAEPVAVGGATLSLTISAGIASTDIFSSATTEELISRADIALYAAKDAGRNRVVQATPDLA
ncbi:MAG: sensor domain-containing diguanylate cyclase [Burkholderiaceae bacterium]